MHFLWLNIVMVLAGNPVATMANYNSEYKEYMVWGECKYSSSANCYPDTTYIQITNKSFPEEVQEIVISDVKTMEIQDDAISSLASVESIKLSRIETLILLPRSLARTNQLRSISITIQHVKNLHLHSETFADWRISDSDSKIIIEDVQDCKISENTFAPSSSISSLKLININTLTIEHDAFAANFFVKSFVVSQVKSVIVETGAFAPNTTVKSMQLDNIASLSLHTGAFARNSFIQQAYVNRVQSLLISSTGIEATISKLTVMNVNMTTCENNTFGSNIHNMSFSSSQINHTEAGCLSASGDSDWEKLNIVDSQFNYVESHAFTGIFDEVKITNSEFNTIEKEGFSLNVTSFLVENSTVGELKEKALEVYAAKMIKLNKCNVNHLRKHAFSLLQLDSSVGSIQIENLKINYAENYSMQFPNGTHICVQNIELNISCTCDMENLGLQLGLPFLIHSKNESKTSQWFNQTRCVSNRTPTLAEYHQEYCLDPTTTASPTTTTTAPPTTTTTAATRSATTKPITATTSMIIITPATTSSTGDGAGQGGGGLRPVATLSSHQSMESGKITTGSVNALVVFITLFAAVIIIAVAMLLIRRCRRDRGPKLNCIDQQTDDSSRQDLLGQPDSQAAAERRETESGTIRPRPTESGSRRFQDTPGQQYPAARHIQTSRASVQRPEGSLRVPFDLDTESRRHPRSPMRSPEMPGDWDIVLEVPLPSQPAQRLNQQRRSTQQDSHPTSQRAPMPGFPMGRRKNPLVRQWLYEKYPRDTQL